MKRIDITKTFRPTPETREFIRWLTETKKIFPRMIDAYLFAAALGIKKDFDIVPIVSKERQHIVVNLVGLIDDDVRLALEAGIYAIRKRKGQPQLSDSEELMEIISQYAEVGIIHLKEKWKDKATISQIQDDIAKIINS